MIPAGHMDHYKHIFSPECNPRLQSGRRRTKVWFRGVLVQRFGWNEAAWSSSEDHRSIQPLNGQICSGTSFVIQVSSSCAISCHFIPLNDITCANRSIDTLLIYVGCPAVYSCLRTFSDAVRPKRAYAHSCNPWCQSVESCDNWSKRSRANTLMMLLQRFSNIYDIRF